MVYGPLSHNPWGVPKPECPKCRMNTTVQVKIKVKGEKVTWECSYGMASEGCLQRPSCVRDVPANRLSDFCFVDYPLPAFPHVVTWRAKGVGKGGV